MNDFDPFTEGPSAVVENMVEWGGRLLPVRRQALMTEEEYVEMRTEDVRRWVARYEIVDIRLNEKGNYDIADAEERLQRAAETARWRYRGYVAGEVDSL